MPLLSEYPAAQRHSATRTAPGRDLVLTGQVVHAVLPSKSLYEFAAHGAQRPPDKKAPGAHTHAKSAVLPLAEMANAGQVWMRSCGKGVVATVVGLARAADICRSTTAASQARAGIAEFRQCPK